MIQGTSQTHGSVRTSARFERRRHTIGNVPHPIIEQRIKDRTQFEAAEVESQRKKTLPTLTLVRAMLASCDRITQPREVVTLASALFDVKEEDIRGGRRFPVISAARSAVMHVMRESLKLSFPDIGRALGRNHSTVITATRRVQKQLVA